MSILSDRITVARIIATVASAYGLRSTHITGKTRRQEVVEPRHIAMHLAREMTGGSYTQIGKLFGGRDHSTVHHACSKISDRRLLEPGLDRDYLAMEARCREVAAMHQAARAA